MYTTNDDTQNSSVGYNKWLKRMDIQLDNQQIKIQSKSPKLLSKRIRKRHYKTLETSVINSAMSHPYLGENRDD